MLVKIEIQCDNAAFDDDLAGEIKRILDIAAKKLANRLGGTSGVEEWPLSDANGNSVGFVSVDSE